MNVDNDIIYWDNELFVILLFLYSADYKMFEHFLMLKMYFMPTWGMTTNKFWLILNAKYLVENEYKKIIISRN